MALTLLVLIFFYFCISITELQSVVGLPFSSLADCHWISVKRGVDVFERGHLLRLLAPPASDVSRSKYLTAVAFRVHLDHGRGWLLLPRRDAVRVAVRVPLAEVAEMHGASLRETEHFTALHCGGRIVEDGGKADRLVFRHELAVQFAVLSHVPCPCCVVQALPADVVFVRPSGPASAFDGGCGERVGVFEWGHGSLAASASAAAIRTSTGHGASWAC